MMSFNITEPEEYKGFYVWDRPPKAEPDYYINTFVEMLIERSIKQWDNLILIIGERGSGKSTCGLELSIRLNPKFTLDHIAFLPSEILQLALDSEPGDANMIDEAGESFSNVDFFTQIQRSLKKAFIGNRYKRQHWILCAPTFQDVQAGLRPMARWLIEVKRRGYAIVYGLKRSPFYQYQLPFRYELFTWYFGEVPIYDKYYEVKKKAGDERIKEYLAEIIKESAGLTVDQVIAEIMTNVDEFRNRKGFIDWHIIWDKYSSKKISQNKAKSIAQRVAQQLK